MTDQAIPAGDRAGKHDAVRPTLHDPARLRRRYAAERRYQAYGLAAILFGLGFLVFLFGSIIGNGWSAFLQTGIRLEIALDKSVIDPAGRGERRTLQTADYTKLAREALYARLGGRPADRKERNQMNGLLSANVDTQIRDAVLADPSIIGTTRVFWVNAQGNVDQLLKGRIDRSIPESRRQLSDRQLAWIDAMVATGEVARRFNWPLFTAGASSQPESAGVGVALIT